jgi:hypothetical protein
MNTDRNTSEAEIEKILRTPSKFTPPAGLKERLIGEVQMPNERLVSRSPGAMRSSGGWLRRWWPVIVPATVSAACAVALTVQQGQIRELRASNQTLSQAVAVAEANAAQANNRVAAPVDTSAEMQQEISRLRDLSAKLKSEIGELRQMQGENTKLRAQVAAPSELALTPDETEALAKAREKAMSIACINNLKQFGLAVRTWELDNQDTTPPDILSMSNELAATKVLVCPADTARQAATDWASFTTANCSYEYLAPNEKDADREPQRVLSRCPVHGHIGMADGSVQSFVAKSHPDWLVERDGKLYLEQPVQPAPQANASQRLELTGKQLEMYRKQGGLPPEVEEQLRNFSRRYGLAQPDVTPPNSQPGAATTNSTQEQLKAFKEHYGIVPANGTTAPNQNP